MENEESTNWTLTWEYMRWNGRIGFLTWEFGQRGSTDYKSWEARNIRKNSKSPAISEILVAAQGEPVWSQRSERRLQHCEHRPYGISPFGVSKYSRNAQHFLSSIPTPTKSALSYKKSEGFVMWYVGILLARPNGKGPRVFWPADICFIPQKVVTYQSHTPLSTSYLKRGMIQIFTIFLGHDSDIRRRVFLHLGITLGYFIMIRINGVAHLIYWGLQWK